MDKRLRIRRAGGSEADSSESVIELATDVSWVDVRTRKVPINCDPVTRPRTTKGDTDVIGWCLRALSGNRDAFDVAKRSTPERSWVVIHHSGWVAVALVAASSPLQGADILLPLRSTTFVVEPRGWRHGRNHGWKVEGDQDLGLNTRALAPRARPKAGLVLDAGEGSPLPL